MINRVLIRIRVVQTLYASYQTENRDLKKAEGDLLFSLQKSYDLYFYFLLLLVELTDTYSKRIELRKSKFLPTQEDMNPNIKLLQNKFIQDLRLNQQFVDYLAERPISWSDQESFVKKLLDDILASDTYNTYISNTESDYNSDREFWRKIFKQFIVCNEELADLLEEESIFWSDDVEIVESFVIKTIKKFEENGSNTLLPMFKDEEDRVFAVKLLREAMLNVKLYRDLITKNAKNWESERITFIDLIIMQATIAELLSFPSIPINVSFNEYINIAKLYSTPKSASFINGILDAIVTDLKNEKKIIKK